MLSGSSGRGKRIANRVAEQVLVPLIGLVIIVAGGFLLGPAIAAAGGHGIRGYWSAGKYVSDRRGGYWVGTFRSADGRLVARHVDYYGINGPQNPGSGIQALYPGGGEVFPPGGSRSAWYTPALFIVLGTGILASRVWRSPLGLWARRKLRFWVPAS